MKNFLTDQHVTIAGHKIPLALLGVVATVGAALLFLRSQNNSNAAAAEAAQASGAGVFGGASGTDTSGTLQNLQTQLQGFMQGLSGLSSASAAAPAAPGVVDPATSISSALAYTSPAALRSGLSGGQPKQQQQLQQQQPIQPESAQPQPTYGLTQEISLYQGPVLSAPQFSWLGRSSQVKQVWQARAPIIEDIGPLSPRTGLPLAPPKTGHISF